MNTFKRLFRHLTTTAGSGRKKFPAAALQAIQDAISRGEKLHRAEVRLIVEASLDMGEILSRLSARERACQLFSDYRIWDTEENCGILVYINLADHDVEIVADRTINRLVGKDTWEEICGVMTSGFAKGEFQQSAIAAIERLNSLLHAVFPSTGTGGRDNQLSNQPLIID